MVAETTADSADDSYQIVRYYVQQNITKHELCEFSLHELNAFRISIYELRFIKLS